MSQFSFFRFFRPFHLFRLGGVCVLGLSCLAGPALAGGGARTDDDDPAVNAKGVMVNNILTILRNGPDSAGRACLNSLTDMHKAQDQLDKEETAQRSSDIGLVRDVLESDMEGVVATCGGDARRLCDSGLAGSTAKMHSLCARLPEAGSGEESDDLQ